MAMSEVFKKFENFETEYMNTKLKVQEMKGRVADGLLPEQGLREAVEMESECCRRFKRWCAQRRDAIPLMLADSTQELAPADRDAWQQFHDEVANRLRGLEAECSQG
jgi:hypothetical protein